MAILFFYRILHKSFKLKVLDIRGRCNESYAVLETIPAADLESLHVGLSSMSYDDPYMGLFLKVSKCIMKPVQNLVYSYQKIQNCIYLYGEKKILDILQ